MLLLPSFSVFLCLPLRPSHFMQSTHADDKDGNPERGKRNRSKRHFFFFLMTRKRERPVSMVILLTMMVYTVSQDSARLHIRATSVLNGKGEAFSLSSRRETHEKLLPELWLFPCCFLRRLLHVCVAYTYASHCVAVSCVPEPFLNVFHLLLSREGAGHFYYFSADSTMTMGHKLLEREVATSQTDDFLFSFSSVVCALPFLMFHRNSTDETAMVNERCVSSMQSSHFGGTCMAHFFELSISLPVKWKVSSSLSLSTFPLTPSSHPDPLLVPFFPSVCAGPCVVKGKDLLSLSMM